MFFFKCIPKDIDISCLKSGTIRLDPRVAEHHPQYEDERADTNVKSCEVEQCAIPAIVCRELVLAPLCTLRGNNVRRL